MGLWKRSFLPRHLLSYSGWSAGGIAPAASVSQKLTQRGRILICFLRLTQGCVKGKERTFLVFVCSSNMNLVVNVFKLRTVVLMPAGTYNHL